MPNYRIESSMSWFDPKTARTLATILLLLGFLGLAWALRQLLLVLVVGVFIAYTLEPLIDSVRRMAPRSITRNWAITVVYLLVLVVAAVGFTWLGREVSAQATALANKLPHVDANSESTLQLPLPAVLEPFRDDVLKYALDFAQTALGSVLHGLGGAVLFLLAPIFALYFLKDGSQMKRNALLFLGRYVEAETVRSLFDELHDLLARYIRAVLLLSVTVFLVYAAYFQITGVPYGLLLASLAAVLEVIPVAGWIAAGGLTLLLAIASGYPHWVALLVFLLVFRAFQDYVMVPWLMSEGIDLHPVAVLAAVIAGELLGGVTGMFLSIPALAAGRILWRHSHRA